VKREAEEDWGGDMRAQPLFLKGPKLRIGMTLRNLQ
jgi:hypothetical protein